MPLQSCQIGIVGFDCDEEGDYYTREWDEVYVNGIFVGTMTGQDNRWNTTYFPVPLEALKLGHNEITVYVGSKRWTTGEIVRDNNQWVLAIKQALVQFDGGKHENAPDVFTLELTSAEETATGITCTAAAAIQSAEARSYVIEYSLVDLSVNEIIADDEENVSGTSITSQGHFYLSSSSHRGNYRIEATLRDDVTGTVYATASYDFNLEEKLHRDCEHVPTGERTFETTNYYKLDKDDALYDAEHRMVDTYSKQCSLCGEKVYDYVIKQEAHTLPVCVCGYVEAGYNPIHSATLEAVTSSVVGEDFVVTVVTDDMVSRVTATNNLNVTLIENGWMMTDNGDGTRTFTFTYQADLPAENRVWTVKAYNNNGRFLSSMDTNGLKIVNNKLGTLDAVQITAPASGSDIDLADDPVLKWNHVKNAESYVIHIRDITLAKRQVRVMNTFSRLPMAIRSNLLHQWLTMP